MQRTASRVPSCSAGARRLGGRDGDRDSHAATRNMMCCAVTGQGAGVAAAIAIKHNKTFNDLNIDLVQLELKRQGARIF